MHEVFPCEVQINSNSKRFRWETQMISQLIDCLLEYKSKMEYRSLDFDADKQIQYQELRVEMARIYADDDVPLFGPVTSIALPDNFNILSKEEKNKAKNRVKELKDLITKGQKRVMEKVKEIRHLGNRDEIFHMNARQNPSRLQGHPGNRAYMKRP